MRNLIFLFFVFHVFNANLMAQMLNPSTTAGPDKFPNFNTDYIKKNHIKILMFDIMDKKDLQIAEDKGLVHYYEFNKEGQLTRFYYTVISKTISHEIHTEFVSKKSKKARTGGVRIKNEFIYDTISTHFYYDNKNHLTMMRFNDGNYYESTYYEYNETNLPIKIVRAKETNASNDKSNFQLGMQYVLSDERFQQVKTSERQIKTICLNDEGRTYKEIISNFDERNHLLSTSESYVATWINQESVFKYNEAGQMIEKNFRSNSGGSINVKTTFEYDEKGNLLTEKQFKNDVLLNELSYIYDETDRRVKSFLNRDHINKSIRITKIAYKFWAE
jgi:hypothetical protein